MSNYSEICEALRKELEYLCVRLSEQTVGSELYYMTLREIYGLNLAIAQNDEDIRHQR
jgi:hypothetical protein